MATLHVAVIIPMWIEAVIIICCVHRRLTDAKNKNRAFFNEKSLFAERKSHTKRVRFQY